MTRSAGVVRAGDENQPPPRPQSLRDRVQPRLHKAGRWRWPSLRDRIGYVLRADALARIAVVMALAAAAAGCLGPGTTQSVRYYVLSPVAADRPATAEHKRMGIMPVRLPGYLDRPALIERRGAQILPHPFSAWAAPLDQEFSRVLAENLQRTQPAYEIATFPWRRSFTPDQRLDVDVVRFEVENGDALLHARWRVLGANGDGVTAAAESRIRMPIAGDDDEARVAALSAALGRFSAEVASALKR